MIKLRVNDKWLNYESVGWSGSDQQCSRQVTFTLPWNPIDTDFKQTKIKLGDLVYLYDGKKRLFVGTVTNREQTDSIGTASYTAQDFMHHLLRSNVTYNFKDTTAENIAKIVCSSLQIKTGTLAQTKVNIKSLLVQDVSAYDTIIQAYRKAKAKNKKKYMAVMDGQKVSVIEKNLSSGVTLTQGKDIIGATYTDSTEGMVDLVKIYDEQNKLLGTVQNKKNVSKFGVYQAIYTKEEGVNAKDEANAMLVDITREASVEALGNIDCIAGKSIKIKDKATGLVGKFYITEDSHTFSNNTHTMSLNLSWENTMEGEEGKESIKKPLMDTAVCYYNEGSSVYHSSGACKSCKNGANKTTVAEIKKITIEKGKNKGKPKYKACSKCWEV